MQIVKFSILQGGYLIYTASASKLNSLIRFEYRPVKN